MTIYQSARKNARQFLTRIAPGPQNASTKIAVVGLPRSGTSWLAKCLSLADSTSYYFEPDHSLDPALYDCYLSAQDEHEDVRACIDDSLAGKIQDEYVIAEQNLNDMLRRGRSSVLLVKWVRLTLALEYIGAHYPKLKVVQIIRHPVPQFLSWKQRGWDPGWMLQKLLKQTNLIGGPLASYEDVMRTADTFWQQAGAYWGAVSSMQLQAHRDGWVLREHEWYCEQPEERLRNLYEHLGLVWTSKLTEFLRASDNRAAGPGYGQARDPRTEIRKWEGKVSKAELEELAGVLEPFDLPFYRDLEPDNWWCP